MAAEYIVYTFIRDSVGRIDVWSAVGRNAPQKSHDQTNLIKEVFFKMGARTKQHSEWDSN